MCACIYYVSVFIIFMLRVLRYQGINDTACTCIYYVSVFIIFMLRVLRYQGINDTVCACIYYFHVKGIKLSRDQ